MSATSPSRPDIVAFMSLASSALGHPLPPPKDIFDFAHGSDRPDLTDLFLQNAILGIKSATTSWPIPDPLHWGVGDYSVILDSEGAPAAVMRTLSLVRCRFRDVEEEFALAEGEGDYEEYREGHLRYYRSQEKEGGERFGEESWVLCERFEVVYAREDLRGEGKGGP